MHFKHDYNKPAESTTVAITIAGQKIKTNEIWSIESQDHYVEISTTNGKRLLRARIVGVAAMLSGVDGIMPHRSYWVPRSAIEKMSSSSNKKILLLMLANRFRLRGAG